MRIRRIFAVLVCLGVVSSVVLYGVYPGLAGRSAGTQHVARNVLFLIADDLRPQFGAYIRQEIPGYFGDVAMRTPHLDALAEDSLLCTRAYVQLSLCGPSRASILTSRRPDTTRVFGNNEYWRAAGGNFTTIPQYFKQQGYLAMGLGKVFHKKQASGKDDPVSWSVDYYKPPFRDSHYISKEKNDLWKVAPDAERQVVPLSDDFTVTTAIKWLDEWSHEASDVRKPFFMAVGFRKPHLPLVCPEKYFNMYSREDQEQFLADKTWQTPDVGGDTFSNLGNGSKASAEAELRQLRHAYYACVSYVDSLVGQLVNRLKDLGLYDSTVISLAADHGYHWGENGHVGKYRNSELSTRIPLLVRVPGVTDGGMVSGAVVEALDLFPTLVEAAGLPSVDTCLGDSASQTSCTEGSSLMPLMLDSTSSVKPAAISQLPAGRDTMQYSIRSTRYRYTAQVKLTRDTLADGRTQYGTDWDHAGGLEELYDHDTDHLERYNVAGQRQNADVKQQLRDVLRAHVTDMYTHPKLT